MTTYPCRITALLVGELISAFLTKNTEISLPKEENSSAMLSAMFFQIMAHFNTKLTYVFLSVSFH